MVALEPEVQPLVGDSAEPKPESPLTGCNHLSAEDRAILENVASHLPLLADLTHADAILFAREWSTRSRPASCSCRS